MLNLSTALAVGLAAITLAFGGVCLVAYNISTMREQLRGRVDLLASDRRGGAQPGERIRPSEGPSLVGVTGLHGDELQFARWLEHLHIPTTYAPRLFVALRVVLALVFAPTLVFLSNRYLWHAIPTLVGIGFLGVMLGWWLPHHLADRSARNRKRALSRGLPDAIELLVIAVEAGLSLEDAMNRIVIELQPSQPAVAEELAITSADLRMLPNRDDALRRLAERADMPSVNSIVTTLSQTLRYGTPLAQALRVAAAELRNDALIRLEEQANRMPVLLTIPMICFILPTLFLIIGGPAFLKVLDVIQHWGGR